MEAFVDIISLYQGRIPELDTVWKLYSEHFEGVQLSHPLQCPDLEPCDCYLFCVIKSYFVSQFFNDGEKEANSAVVILNTIKKT
ncbi:MAG: hypothetical protein EZS28_029207 [Streblomastix strix]|uniref:Uncharacterized protein n=1 Tax=Streblomastix strix TaxID=222440 RepID=A0A5J4UZS6_9EUKA|nr:MAG: hypothetical protein EZS28_029207 [Streblomastix strix]